MQELRQDVIVDLVDQCRTYKQRVVQLVNSTSYVSCQFSDAFKCPFIICPAEISCHLLVSYQYKYSYFRCIELIQGRGAAQPGSLLE